MLLRAILLCALMALPAKAEEVVAGLSQARVAITTGFSGSEILVFGAVKRQSPIPQGEPLHVIVAISGPNQPVTIRKKDRQFGIWVNTETARIPTAPSFYAVSTTAPLDTVLSPEADEKHKISIPKSIRQTGIFLQVEDAAAFVYALIRIRSKEELYQLRESAVELTDETLFRTSVKLPANLTEGDYAARFFLTRGGEVIDQHQTTINVRKVGLERWIYNLAHDLPLVYGLLSLAVAIAAGWGASAVFRLIRF